MLENSVIKTTNGILRIMIPFNIIKIDNKNIRNDSLEEHFMFHIGRDILLSSSMNANIEKSKNDFIELENNIEDAIKHIDTYSIIYINRVQSGGLVLTFNKDYIISDYSIINDVKLVSLYNKFIKEFFKIDNARIITQEAFAYFNESDDNYKDEFDFIRSFDNNKLKNIKTILNDKSKKVSDMESKMKILNEGSTFLFISVVGLWLSLNTKGDYEPENKWIDHNTVAYNIVFYIIYNNIYNGKNDKELSNLIINIENISTRARHSKLAKILSNNVIGVLLARIIDIDSCCDYYNSRSVISEPLKEIKKINRVDNDYAYDVIECIKNEICPFSQDEYNELINTFIQFNTERDNLESQKLQNLLNNLTVINLLVTMSGIGFITLLNSFDDGFRKKFSLVFTIIVIILSIKPIVLIFRDYFEDFFYKDIL